MSTELGFGLKYSGAPLVFFNHASVMSYYLARQKSDMFGWNKTEAQLKAYLVPGSHGIPYHEWIARGGAWWQHCQPYKDCRDKSVGEKNRVRIYTRATFMSYKIKSGKVIRATKRKLPDQRAAFSAEFEIARIIQAGHGTRQSRVNAPRRR